MLATGSQGGVSIPLPFGTLYSAQSFLGFRLYKPPGWVVTCVQLSLHTNEETEVTCLPCGGGRILNPGCASRVRLQGPQAGLRCPREAQEVQGALRVGSFPEERLREPGLQVAGGCREPDWMLHLSEHLLYAREAAETVFSGR